MEIIYGTYNDSMMNAAQSLVSFSIFSGPIRNIGVVNLNRPQSLNSLTLDMVTRLVFQLEEWESDPDIDMIFIHSDHQHFCAGGDVKEVRKSILTSQTDSHGFSRIQDFFLLEYFADYILRTYRKPVVTWGHGVTMGAGLGLFSSGHVKILSPETTLAMPEITIGFFCDVGASFFLNQVPQPIGHYIGITGARFNATDAIELKVADFIIPLEKKEDVLEMLSVLPRNSDVFDGLSNFNSYIRPAGQLLPNLQKIKSLASDSIHEFHEKLQKSGLPEIAQVNAASPLSLGVIFDLMERGRNLSVEDAFILEWHLAIEFSKRPDFPEGVRALLVDKDKKPRWSIPSMDDLDSSMVRPFFDSLNKENLMSRHIQKRVYKQSLA